MLGVTPRGRRSVGGLLDASGPGLSIAFSRYPQRLQLYATPPELELSVEDFEAFALDRLRVLKAIETAKIRNKEKEELKAAVVQAEEKFMPLHFNTAVTHNLEAERRKDHISHFILRLAYCRSEEMRRWFLTQECALFRHRLEQEMPKDLVEFVQLNRLDYLPIPYGEKEQLSSQLRASSGAAANKNFENEDFFKVPFEEALELVAHRKVFVSGGFAYVPSAELITLITHVFRMRLSHALAVTAKNLPQMEEDERLVPILNNMNRQTTMSTYQSKHVAAGEGVSADGVEGLIEHFPLCMRHLHEELKVNSHLKYGGRLQYGLFLKGIGMSMQEALIFWRRAFQTKVPEDKFQKSYAYNIRYNYGQEGKRADFNPFNCMKIIMGNAPGPGDHHGCPFRHFSPDNLRATMRSNGVSESSVGEIIRLVDNQHFQIACTRYYEVTHKSDAQVQNITHPNDYFDMSMGRPLSSQNNASAAPTTAVA